MDRRALDWMPTTVSTSAGLTASFLHAGDPSARARVALATRDGDGWAEMTYAELDRRSARVRTWLAAHGIGAGDRVGLLGDSENDWVAAFLGVLRAGAVVMPLDTRLTVEELAQIWARGTPTALVVSRRLHEPARAMLAGLGPAGFGMAGVGLSPPLLLLDEVATCAEAGGAGDIEQPMDEPAVVVWTSGTTGTAKGVCLTLANLDYVVTESTAVQGTGPGDHWLSILSLNHMLELACGLLACLRAGGTFCFARSLMPREVVEAMQQRGTTRMMVVPLVLRLLHDGPT